MIHRLDRSLKRLYHTLVGTDFTPIKGVSLMGCKLVAYRRVSTQKQGRSGLGLEAQDVAIAAMADSTGCNVVATFTEVETGKRADRPELAKARPSADVARRLLRSASWTGWRERAVPLTPLRVASRSSSVTFRTSPRCGREIHAHLVGGEAEMESGLVSERTKAALAADKARGGLSAHPCLSAAT